MAEIRRFTFDTDFTDANPANHGPDVPEDELAEEEEEEAPPPPPTFTEEELADAREAAFAQGKDEGIRETEAATERMAANALNVIAAGLQALTLAQTRANEETSRSAIEVAVAVTGKILPATVKRHGTVEIEDLVAKIMPHLLDQPRIIIRAHGSVTEGLKEQVEALGEANGFEGRVVVMPDDKTQPGDCRIEWADGGAERSAERTWEEIEAVVQDHIEASETNYDAPPEETAKDTSPETAQQEAVPSAADELQSAPAEPVGPDGVPTSPDGAGPEA